FRVTAAILQAREAFATALGTQGATEASMPITVDAKGATTGTGDPAKVRQWSAPARGEWAQSLSNKKSDPINFYVHGSLEEVKKAFLKAGWVLPMQNTTGSKL